MGNGQQYLRNLVRTIMGQMGISLATEIRPGETAHDLYKRHTFAIEMLLRKMRAETLGRIIAQAKPVIPSSGGVSIKDVNPWLDLNRGGLDLLRQLTAAVIVAEMAEDLHRRTLTAEYIGDDVQSSGLREGPVRRENIFDE